MKEIATAIIAKGLQDTFLASTNTLRCLHLIHIIIICVENTTLYINIVAIVFLMGIRLSKVVL